MQKQSKLLLDDYILSKSDMDLKLFVQSVNPMFILSNKKKTELEVLINKFVKDNNKLR